MKKSILFSLPLAALLAASCSSDDNIDNGGNNSGNGGDAYVAVSINMPTTNGMRAAEDPTFDNGDAAEYNVKDVTVLIFNQNDEFEQYYSTENGSLTAPTVWQTNTNGSNITTSATTVPLRVADKGDKHVIVVLNNNKKHDFSTLAKLSDLQAMLNTTGGNTSAQGSANYGSYTTTATDGCFFMTSSPYISNGDSKLVTYATITPQVTAAQAQANPGTVYVERILGKVSLTTPSSANWGSNNWTYTIPDGTVNGSSSVYSGGSVKFENWTLDVTNNSSYILRNVAASDVENSGTWTTVSNLIGGNQSGMKRIYWAKDNNYDAAANTGAAADATVKAGLFTTLANGDVAKVNGELGVPQYCFENTFDTDNQRQDRTTRVLFKAQFTPKGFTAGTTWYTVGASSTPLTQDQLEARITAAVTAAGKTATLKTDWQNELKCTTTALPKSVFSTEPSDEDLTAINSALGKLQVYENGECYYVGRIRHFVDLTGGDAWPAGGRTPNFYNSTKDLGRYGIVRNNWYQLTVNTISQPGSPAVPVPDTEWDDVNNYYIDCTINILSWAVRTQGFDF